MDVGDLFRRFFGLPPRSHPDWNNRFYPDPADSPQEDSHDDGFFYDEDDEEDDHFEFFIGSPSHKDGLDGMFEHFHGGIFSQMEHLHRQMEDMMRGFGGVHFPPGPRHPALPPGSPSSPDAEDGEKKRGDPFNWFGNPSPFFHQGPKGQPKSPRDFMLKEGVDVDPLPPSDPAPPQRSPKIGPIFTPSKPPKVQDSDLDGKLSDDDIQALVKSEIDQQSQPIVPFQPQRPQQQQPGFFSSSSSVTFSSFTGADGKVEKKRVVRDSSGREETTVTRSVGDQSHSVTMVTTNDGSQEKHEQFHNMDENDLSNFDKMWTSRPQQPVSPVQDLLSPSPGPRIHPQDKDIFSQLLGFGGNK